MGGNMMNVGILGATGYTGLELIRLLSKHPYVNIVYLTSRSFDENTISDVYPSLENFCKIPLEKLNLEKAVGLCDLIFNTLPSEYAFSLSKTSTTTCVISGPIPSPGINVTLCIKSPTYFN
jgi:N-acetyl-gamma-glutamyl-phosphate reductase